MLTSKSPSHVYVSASLDTVVRGCVAMGLLSEGTPLTWPQTKSLAGHVRKHGVEQFINHYKTFKHRNVDSLKWGDEVSCFP